MIKKVAVIGLGYVGLPTFVAINRIGKYNVIGFDVNIEKIKMIRNGDSPIEDDDVRIFLKTKQVQVTSIESDLLGVDVFIVCVPTPIFADYTPDYGPVELATKLCAKFLKKGNHFVLESTVNPGTCEEVVKPILESVGGLKAGVDFNIAHCPERINPGDKKWNIYNINRNIGSINRDDNKVIANFYRSFITDAIINEMSCLKVAESTKIVENTFRDINIAYVNELAQSFDAMNIDLYETIIGASNKPFSFMAHWPGCGVGGHCIAVDPYYLIKRASQDGFNHRFLKIAREINNSMPEYTVNKLAFGLNELGLPVKGTRITLLGLSYKANIGDLRESPALEIEKRLRKLGADLVVFDPYVDNEVKSLDQAIKGVKAVVLATNHKIFIDKLPEKLQKSKVKLVVDGRNCLDKKEIECLGIIYKGIGK